MEHNVFSLTGKAVLVTGASSGIGRAVAVEVSRMGGRAIVTGRNHERLSATYDLLLGSDHEMIPCDLNSSDGRRRLIEGISEVDGIVNCVGIVDVVPFRFLSQERLQNMLDTNFVSSAVLVQQMLRAKRLRDAGSIVFMGSVSGTRRGILGNSAYSASKGAICGLAKNLALELAPKAIRVNTILPGMIETNVLKNSAISEGDFRKNIERYPLGRYGKPEEVAYLAVYLLSDASSWMTGSEIVLDGGFTI